MLEPSAGRLVFIELAFDRRADVPDALMHRFDILAVPLGGTEPTPMTYTAATFPLDLHVPELGPPLKGGGWVAANGCCETDGIHRATVLPVNGGLHDTQRFAIDWMRMNDEGRLVVGDPSDVHSYVDYGAEIIAVAGGTVVSTLNTLDDQVPGQLPDPSTITLQNVDGNHVVVRHRDGRYAFYAHMQKGSVTVEAGDRVRRGEMLGRLGNTGNTSAPHLHFHLMDGASVLGSSGCPTCSAASSSRGRWTWRGGMPPRRSRGSGTRGCCRPRARGATSSRSTSTSWTSGRGVTASASRIAVTRHDGSAGSKRCGVPAPFGGWRLGPAIPGGDVGGAEPPLAIVELGERLARLGGVHGSGDLGVGS